MLEFVEGGIDVVIEGLGVRASKEGDHEDKKTCNGDNEAHDLPEDVVATVGRIDVTLEGVKDEEVEREGNEVLDGEAPPVLEDGLPPVGVGVASIFGESGH